MKKRKKGVYRSVPVPPELLDALNLVHGLREGKNKKRKQQMWPWSRSTAWRRVKKIMEAAGIEGVHASPKGLRHGFGVACAMRGISLNMIQKWFGHADIRTTAIYTNALGEEEQKLAARLWET